MLVKTKNKMDAVQALHNILMKDTKLYCNACGSDYDKLVFPCCDTPQIGTHLQHCLAVVKENEGVRQTRANPYGSDKGKNMRWGISVPPRYLRELQILFEKTQHGKKLFETNQDLYDFMKRFPKFCTCERI